MNLPLRWVNTGPLSTFDFPGLLAAPGLTNFSLLFTWRRVRCSSRLNSHSCFRFRHCFCCDTVSFRYSNLQPPTSSPQPSTRGRLANLEASFPHLVFILLYICCQQLRSAVNSVACHHLLQLQLQFQYRSQGQDENHHHRHNHRHHHHHHRPRIWVVNFLSCSIETR